MNNGGVPRGLRSELIYAAAAANAWLRGLALPAVALHYRYEPITALRLIQNLCRQYGVVNVEPWVPAHVLSLCTVEKNSEPAQPVGC
jgi:hypothetical protein